MACLNCQTGVKQTPGKRQKLYCSESCRVEFFRKKKAGDNPKKNRGRPTKVKLNAEPISNIQYFEPPKEGFTAINPTTEANIANSRHPDSYEPLNLVKSFRDYMDLIKTASYDQKTIRQKVQTDKKLNSNQKAMIYSKLK